MLIPLWTHGRIFASIHFLASLISVKISRLALGIVAVIPILESSKASRTFLLGLKSFTSLIPFCKSISTTIDGIILCDAYLPQFIPRKQSTCLVLHNKSQKNTHIKWVNKFIFFLATNGLIGLGSFFFF